MEDNHRVIMDKFPSNLLIAKIQMTSNKMFPLTLKPSKKKNTTLFFGKEKDVQSNTAFTVESVCSIRKGENNAKIKASFQSEIHDDSWLWNFRFGFLNFGGMKLLDTKDMVKGFPFIEKPERICEGCIFESNTENHFQLASLTQKKNHWK
jgi:hypothetical protein